MFLNPQKLLGSAKQCGDIPNGKTLLSKTLKIAWPAMLENFMITLVMIIDTMMVGALGATAIAAVGLSTQPKFIALSVFLSFNIAVSSLVARRIGEGKKLEANKILATAVMGTILLSFVVSTLVINNIEFIIGLMQGQPDTTKLAIEYFSIIVMGFFFATCTLVINAVQRGAGNTKITMRTNIVSNLVNVVLNYLLISGNLGFPRWEVKGAAIATVIGSACAFVMSVASVSKKGSYLYLWDKENIGIFKQDIKALFKIGIPSFVEQLFQRIGFFIYVMTVSSLGTFEFAAHQIGMNITMLSFSMGEGLAFASIALIGRSLGEKRPDMAKLYGATCQRIGFLCSCFFSVAFLLFGQQLFSMFTTEPGVLMYAMPISRILCLITFLQISSVIYSGCLRGAGDAAYIAFVTLISIAIIRPFVSYSLAYTLGYGLIGAWVALAIDQSIRLTMTFMRFKSNKWTEIKL